MSEVESPYTQAERLADRTYAAEADANRLAESLEAILIDLHSVLDAEDNCVSSTCIAARNALRLHQENK
ncbi:hypothetical protein LCGC14_2181190 [marine sediment metagenome]|uniref:Uncharacterized protein n=1 Tax=marine sediment metagenome TaxID=412755 RepID=A0A0F9DME4_9ZZZZ